MYVILIATFTAKAKAFVASLMPQTLAPALV